MTQDQDTEKERVVAPNIFAQPLSIFDLPVDRDTIFLNHKGIYKSRVEKRQRRLIVKVTALKPFLRPNELIRCLTTGYSPVSVIEQVLTGPAFLFFGRAIFIFTNMRILHVRTSFRRKVGSAVSQILYEDCSAVFMKGRSLAVIYKNGQREIFNYIGRPESRKIKVLFEELPLQKKTPAVFGGRVALCPNCTNVLTENCRLCNVCKLKFRSPLSARLLSAVFPGGGYLYCKHKLLGAMAAIVEIGAIGFLVAQWMAYRKGLPLQWGPLAVVAAGLILEKTVTAFHSGLMCRDHIPGPTDFDIRRRGRG